MKEQNINCPKCGEPIDVSDVLSRQVESRLAKEFEARQAEREKELERVIRERLQNENDAEISAMKNELAEKSTRLRELNKTKAEIERLRREKEDLREEIALEKEIEFSEKLKTEKSRIRGTVEEEYTFKLRELEKQLEDQKELAAEMKRKADQGSVQLQGEVQELELERILRELYVFDEITEIKKGQRGADTLQCVRNPYGAECGKIYYESKRTKNFDANWLKKLREDNQVVTADILVLVTAAMPDGCDGYVFQDGVWICNFWQVRGLSMVLRHGLLDVHARFQIQQGKETKAEMLYDFLTSQEFKGQFEGILEGFKSIQDGYSREKLQMTKIWKEREKQLDRILLNASGFYGSVRGIAGPAMPQVNLLEPGDSELGGSTIALME
ncbi:MAG: DUF2130 domain-containing protein [Chloracidobacterium sp.]|nr:DUF2130 domain-containing protein [Chloracidobacterium sp.]